MSTALGSGSPGLGSQVARGAAKPQALPQPVARTLLICISWEALLWGRVSQASLRSRRPPPNSLPRVQSPAPPHSSLPHPPEPQSLHLRDGTRGQRGVQARLLCAPHLSQWARVAVPTALTVEAGAVKPQAGVLGCWGAGVLGCSWVNCRQRLGSGRGLHAGPQVAQEPGPGQIHSRQG